MDGSPNPAPANKKGRLSPPTPKTSLDTKFHTLPLQFPNIVNDLHKERVISNFPDAINVAKHVDCLWFNGGMPFAFEVKHSTGVTSGLTRMNALRTQMEFSRTNYVIVADDNARNEVLKKASDPQFNRMDLWYMPYSAVSEMHAFTIRHRNHGVNRDFMKSFMEQLNQC